MSWSVGMIGKPQNIIDALDKRLAEMQDGDYSKDEFAAALPYLKGLLAQNFNNRTPENTPSLKLVAIGHGTYEATGTNPKADIYRSCVVSIDHVSTQIV